VDTILLFFVLLSLLALLKLRKKPLFTASWFFWLFALSTSLAAAFCVKFVGIGSLFLSAFVLSRDIWLRLPNQKLSTSKLFAQSACYAVALLVWPIAIYVIVFYVHLSVLVNAGPHDNIMTSAFQASLNGGLASIIRGQPLEIAHGSQITLKHTHGRACWMHSHAQVYPVRYPDGRGSSHQQQVTCYSFKDVNNWWIVKKPEKYAINKYKTTKISIFIFDFFVSFQKRFDYESSA
jgi:dolichyl-phosphate-mannose-protein mannosyltransferase